MEKSKQRTKFLKTKQEVKFRPEQIWQKKNLILKRSDQLPQDTNVKTEDLQHSPCSHYGLPTEHGEIRVFFAGVLKTLTLITWKKLNDS